MSHNVYRLLRQTAPDVLDVVGPVNSLRVGGVDVPVRYGSGRTYYVSAANGNNDRSGRSPTRAKAALQSGIDACTDYRGDQLVLLADASSGTSQVIADTSFAFNCFGLTLRGTQLVNPFQPEQCLMYRNNGGGDYNGIVAEVTQPTLFMGVTFGSVDNGSYPAVRLNGTAGSFGGSYNCFVNCRFVDWNSCPTGVQCFGSSYNTFINCVFEGFDKGIEFETDAVHNPVHNHVIGCTFVNCTYGVEASATATSQDILIQECTFIDSKVFNANGVAGNGLITGCFLETATDGASYSDTVNNLNTLGYHFSGMNYDE